MTEIQYTILGWSLVPIPNGSKLPVIAWTAFQKQTASAEQVESWLSDGNGLGVVCGEVSQGLVCLDFYDIPAYESWAARTVVATSLPIARSQRGFHVFYRSNRYQRNGKLYANGHEVGHVLGNGEVVVLPPTRHPFREWERQPSDSIPVLEISDMGLEIREVEEDRTITSSEAEPTLNEDLESSADRYDLAQCFLAALELHCKSGRNCRFMTIARAILQRESTSDQNTAPNTILEALAKASEPLRAVEVNERSRLTLQTVRNTLTALNRQGKVSRTKIGREFYYRIPE